MCGICASVILLGNSKAEKPFLLKQESDCSLRRRGPDHFGSKSARSHRAHLDFYSSVLHLRGDRIITQPYVDDKGNVLLWNGEIFGGSLYSEENVNDTVILSTTLAECQNTENVLNVISGIKGPYAFIYYQKEKGLLWFGRDIFGRRSLLWSFSQHLPVVFVLSSIALGSYNWEEIPCDGVYSVDITNSPENRLVVNKYLWSRTPSGLSMKSSVPDFCDNALFEIAVSSVQIQSPVTVPLNTALPCSDLIAEFPSGQILEALLQHGKFASTVAEFEVILSKAVCCRVKNQNFVCKDCVLDPFVCDGCRHASVSILFSGGLDSIVVAAIAGRYLPEDIPIDLLNVAFGYSKKGEKTKGGMRKSIPDEISYDTPDRITGRNGVAALQKLNANRRWNFVEINVNQEQLQKERNHRICHVISPSCTVLDDSIGCAIWFATNGRGTLRSESGSHTYSSPSRVVLVGTGADELLAGYSRHRVRFNSGGWKAVVDELVLEIDRISSRNLGRDDRIMADHGREARFPFLDEDVVCFLNKLPVWLKTDLRYPRGFGEKLLLRLLALRLGLEEAAVLPKRAIQFGSRIARCENSKEKASDLCERLKRLDVPADA